MPQVTKTFLLDTTDEFNAFTVDTATDITVSHNTADTDADGAGDNGQVQAALSTKNRNRTGHIRILQSWEDLGVPAGATVTHIQVTYSERQSVNALSSNSDTGPFELRNSANNALDLTLLDTLNRTSTSNYADRISDTLELASPEASNIQHTFRLTHRLQTPNTAGAGVTILHDYIRITVTYNDPPAGGLIKVRIGSNWTDKSIKVRIGSNWVEKPLKKFNGATWELS